MPSLESNAEPSEPKKESPEALGSAGLSARVVATFATSSAPSLSNRPLMPSTT
jgi:hypothetical protein